MTVTGVPSHTVTRGHVAWANGRFDAIRGPGRNIDRRAFTRPAEAKRIAKAARGRTVQPA